MIIVYVLPRFLLIVTVSHLKKILANDKEIYEKSAVIKT